MPRPRRTTTPVVPTTAIMASGHRYSGKVPRIYRPSTDRQKRAYHHFRICGEARFAARYFGHALSRATLYVADGNGVKQDKGPGSSLLTELFGGPEGQSGMLESVGVHLTVAGECYLVGREVDGADIWEVLSVLEVDGSVAGWKILDDDSQAWIALEDKDVVIRIWVPQPGSRWEADSPFLSMLPVLDEIERLTRYIGSQTISGLTGNGLLVIPDDITFPPPPERDGKAQEYANEAEGFMLMLGEMMSEALKGDGSAAEQVPGVLMVNAEAIDKIQHLKFWTELDENARVMRQDAIHRFALGMDLPPEMVLGMGSNEGTGGGSSNGVSHWGAWMIEEQAIKMHIEPMLDLLCTALTVFYLRPLSAKKDHKIKADTSALRLRPDRSAESLELLDRGLIKPEVAVVENGFAVEDMMDEKERRIWLLMKVASGSSTPEQVQAALAELGVPLNIPEPVGDPSFEEPRETPQPPSLDEHPVRPKTPDPAESQAARGAYEVLVLRALERAGNRLRNMTQSKPPGKAYEAHIHLAANGSTSKVLEDAWDMAEVALVDVPNREVVVATLDNYCRALIANREPYSRESLAAWCEKAGV